MKDYREREKEDKLGVGDTCIGNDNRKEINNIKDDIRTLKSKVESLQTLKADADAIHKIELDISKMAGAMKEMQNNRKEDRQVMSSMNESLGEVNSILEEYMQGSIIQTAQQQIMNEKQETMIDTMLNMQKAIGDNSIANQIKEFSNTSKYHKWILRFVLFMLFFTLIGMFNFYNMDGNLLQDIFDFIRGG